MKTYRITKHIKAENMYDALQKERNFHPHEIEEISNDKQPMGYGENKENE